MAEIGNRIKIQTSAERAEEARQLVLPNPGDLIIALIFGWSLFCFFLVTGGEKMLNRVAALARTKPVQDAIKSGDETILTALMVGGSGALVFLVVMGYRYRKALIGVSMVAFCFSNASWKPLHDPAWLLKYLIIVFFASVGGLFLVKNFWRLLSLPYVRLFLYFYIYVAIIQLALGGKTDDIWYIGTDMAYIFGFAIAWLAWVKDTDSLMEFNKIVSWAAVAITLLHAMAPFVGVDHIESGRFRSMYARATGFAVFFSPMVLALYWRTMTEKNDYYRYFFTAMAALATILMLWSGTRSAALALIIALTMMWYVFRTRIFVYMLAGAAFILVVQIIGGQSSQDVFTLVDRLQDTSDTGRFETWAQYIQFITQSPIFGHSLTGVKRLFYTSGTLAFFDNVGVAASGGAAPHNAYIGTMARFGVIGIGLLLGLIFIGLKYGRRVYFSSKIPNDEKAAYMYPLGVVVLVCVACIFEDVLGNTGKGTITAYLFYPSLIFCVRIGEYLLDKYEPPVGPRRVSLGGTDSAASEPAASAGNA